jgi:6-phosphofructokinase 1
MNIAVAQSGGPTSAINSSLLGVIKEALKFPEISKIYGAVNGIEGIIKNNLVDLSAVAKDKDISLLRQTPATALGSCRYKLPEFSKDKEVYKTITERFNQYDIKAFFYIGGNDSMDTVYKLSTYFAENNIDIKVIGIPKTIDNDLCVTDHTPGFGSAAKFVATTIKEIARDNAVYDLSSVIIVEIMGRHAGWLAASSAVLHADNEVAPHLVYLPECKFSLDKFLDDVRKQLTLHKSVIVAVSEGINVSDADSGRSNIAVDAFGHTALSGVGKFLEKAVKTAIGCKVRSVELNVLQRCSSHISSLTDIDEAERIGAAAVLEAIKGESGKMMAFKRVSDAPYEVSIISADAKLVANSEKFFPSQWINEEENNIKDEALSYFLPLIMGEQEIKTKNGLPIHFKLDNILN